MLVASGFLLLAGVARGAAFDLVEVGGPWGTPTSTDATSPWWNPAGLAMGKGTRLELELAGVLGGLDYRRSEPRGGLDVYSMAGIVPYLGLASDLGTHSLGVGAALAVPQARGGTEAQEPGAGSFQVRSASIQTIEGIAGLAWRPVDALSAGVVVAALRSRWKARLDTETLTELDASISAMGEDSGYTDALFEDPDYAATVDFSTLADTAWSGGLGLLFRPHPAVDLGLSFQGGASVSNRGTARIAFGCPPQSDELGRFGAEQYGLCDATLDAAAAVAYSLPWRLRAGIALRPSGRLRVELMGGFVAWSVFHDYRITLSDAETLDDLPNPAAADLVDGERLWARDAEDSYWVGLDLKARPRPRLLVGGRALYDRAAIPDLALSPNNYDADTLLLSGLLAVRVAGPFELGMSATHGLVARREVVESGFGVTLDPEQAREDRWFYPHAAGTYEGRFDRLGLSARAEF